MKLSVVIAGVLSLLMIAWSVGRVQGKLETVNAQEKVIFVSPDKTLFHISTRSALLNLE